MALPQPKSAVAAADIIRELEFARGCPEAGLRSAVVQADEIAPAVIDVVKLAASGVYLLPKEQNLLFWGIHAMAAARRPELFHPLMQFLRRSSEDQLDRLIGDTSTDTLAGILLSVFDGNAAAIIEACLDARVCGLARWQLFKVLARLTFDGAVARAATLDVLDRFDREQLAGPRDFAWMGWQDAVVLLGVEEMREKMHATWQDGRNPQRKVDQEDLDRTLSMARAMAPGDPALFMRDGIAALDDPVVALGWASANPDNKTRSGRREPIRDADPADLFALRPEDIDWLNGFFDQKYHRSSGLLEMIDGYFCGLIAAPGTVQPSDSISSLWGDSGPLSKREPERLYDSLEQEVYTTSLLTRHWNTIAHRLAREYPHAPLLQRETDIPEGAAWAVGFVFATTLRVTDWERTKGDEFFGNFLVAMSGLAGREQVLQRKLTSKERYEIVAMLPAALQTIYDRCHGRIDPLRRPSFVPEPLGMKIGRNEPCPCRSGKKYKHCCGSPEKIAPN